MFGDEEFKGNGYCGNSMSNNAVAAYNEGKMPLSKWRKKDILAGLKRQHVSVDFLKAAEKTSLPVLKNKLLEYTEYHHTSLRYNITNFYGVIHIENQEQELMLMQQMAKAQKDYSKKNIEKKAAPKTIKSPTQYYLVKFSHSTMSADGKHKKVISGEGVIDEKWCHLKDGTKRKLNGKHFDIIETIGKMPTGFSLEDFYDGNYQYDSHWEY